MDFLDKFFKLLAIIFAKNAFLILILFDDLCLNLFELSAVLPVQFCDEVALVGLLFFSLEQQLDN